MGILVLMILFFAGFPMVCAMMAVAYDIKNPTPKGYYTVNDEGKIVRNPELEEEETKKVLIPDNIKKRGQTRSTQRMDAKVTEVRVKDNTVKKIVLENIAQKDVEFFDLYRTGEIVDGIKKNEKMLEKNFLIQTMDFALDIWKFFYLLFFLKNTSFNFKIKSSLSLISLCGLFHL